MEMTDKRICTAGGTAAFVLITGIIIWSCFAPSVRTEQEQVKRREQTLAEAEALVSRKAALQTEWETKKEIFMRTGTQEEISNAWLRTLLNYSQSQSLTIEKMEPAGIKNGPRGKETLVFLSFRGNILKLIEFIYHLSQADPLARIESFSVRLEEGETQNLSYELLIGKTLP